MKNLKYFPILMDIHGRAVVLVGAGKVAQRKCLSLVKAGADVMVIAPELSSGMKKLAAEGKIRHMEREYRRGDLKNATLVFAATDNQDVNKTVAEEAAQLGIPANIADSPEISTFISPSIVSRGDLVISVSTGGKSPVMAQKIRQELEAAYGPEYDPTLRLLSAVREKLLTEKRGSQYNKKLIAELVSRNLPGLFRKKSYNEIDRLLGEILGPGFTLNNLEVGRKRTPHD
jgi:precorrin-2 dehydrogenase/sirohydrochlorin ferrochelatase